MSNESNFTSTRMAGIGRYLQALDEIEQFYGEKRAKRSGARLINHINEGCAIISGVIRKFDDMPFDTMAAFCLHPIFQSDDVDPATYPFKHVHADDVVRMAKAYAEVANMYLCREETDHIQNANDLSSHLGNRLIEKEDFFDLVVMLYADKVQNRKDFEVYHWRRHKRSDQLERYFNIWIDYLGRWIEPEYRG